MRHQSSARVSRKGQTKRAAFHRPTLSEAGQEEWFTRCASRFEAHAFIESMRHTQRRTGSLDLRRGEFPGQLLCVPDPESVELVTVMIVNSCT